MPNWQPPPRNYLQKAPFPLISRPLQSTRLLTISGEKKHEEEQKEKGCYHLERSYGSFRRDLNLPNDVDTTEIDAACKDGVLTITLPEAEKAKAVKVKIKEQ